MELQRFFQKSQLIPAIIQEKGTNQVLMMAYMNEESLQKTLETGYTWFYSRSRQELWNKGATSGNVQKVLRITPDCDQDTLLILVEQSGPACHTGNHSCFFDMGSLYGDSPEEDEDQEAMSMLFSVVKSRKNSSTEGSYTCYLFEKGLDKILKKCGEECSEVLIAAKNLWAETKGNEKEDEEKLLTLKQDVREELCDLLYHLTVLMVQQEINWQEINDILQQRSRKIGNLKTIKQTDHQS